MSEVDLSHIGYTFGSKPLLFAGKAMEYYGVREANDIDFIISQEDYHQLAKIYPSNTKILSEDRGIVIDGCEFWSSFYRFEYPFLSVGAQEVDTYLVMSLEKLLFLKALTIENPKSARDVRLLARHILNIQYGATYSSKEYRF